MMGYRQQRPKIGLTVCPDLVDHYIWTLLKELFSWTPIGMLTMHWGEIWAFFDTLPAGAANKGKAIVDGLIGGITAKWESLKAKIKALTDLLPDWMKGGGSVTANVNPSGYLTGNYNTAAMAGGSGYSPRIVEKPHIKPKASTTINSQPFYNLTVNAAPGMDESRVASIALEKIREQERANKTLGRAGYSDRN